MNLISWGDHFLTGIDAVDAQHKGLVFLINSAAPLLAESGAEPAQKVQPLLDRVVEYAATHFTLEEALMAERGIDRRYIAHHHQLHEDFSTEVQLMRAKALANDNLTGNELLRFLTGWLSFHILTEDQQVAAQLRAMAAGASAEQAYQAIDRGNSPALPVLTDAMVEVFGVLIRRNRELSTLNAELNAARNELLVAKAQLEASVAESAQESRDQQSILDAASARVAQAREQVAHAERTSVLGRLAEGGESAVRHPIRFVIGNLNSLTDYVDRLHELLAAHEAMAAELKAAIKPPRPP